MLSTQHSNCSTSFVLAQFLHSRVFPVLVLLHLAQIAATLDLRNISIPVTSPQIVYTPFVCNASDVLANPQACAGAWQLSNSSDDATTTTTTTGPSPASANILPQMFFQFRASELVLITLPSSNATANLTISANGIIVSTLFESRTGSATILNLPESDISLLTLTFIPSTLPTRFDLQSLTITVPANASIASFLPTPTLPPSASLPTFSLPNNTSAVPSSPPPSIPSSNKTMIAQAVGLTIGLGLGLTALAVLAFYYWRRRRQQRRNVSMQETKSEWNPNGFMPS